MAVSTDVLSFSRSRYLSICATIGLVFCSKSLKDHKLIFVFLKKQISDYVNATSDKIHKFCLLNISLSTIRGVTISTDTLQVNG